MPGHLQSARRPRARPDAAAGAASSSSTSRAPAATATTAPTTWRSTPCCWPARCTGGRCACSGRARTSWPGRRSAPAMAIEIEADLDAGRRDRRLAPRRVEQRPRLAARPRRARPTLLAASQLAEPFERFIAINPPLATGGGAERNAVPLYDFPAWSITSHRLLAMPIRTSALRTLGAFANVFAHRILPGRAGRRARRGPAGLSPAPPRRIRARAPCWRRRPRAPAGAPGASARAPATASASPATRIAAPIARSSPRSKASAEIRVRRLVAAVDVGEVINPDGVANQIEGGAIQATSWTLKEAVRFDRTRITSDSWESYPILRFSRGARRRGRDHRPAAGEAAWRRRGGARPDGGGDRQRRVRCAGRARARPADHARAHHRGDGLKRRCTARRS